MVTHPDLELYVTWAALEENLKGIRESLDSAMQHPNKDTTGSGKSVPSTKELVPPTKEAEQRFTQTVNILFYLTITVSNPSLCFDVLVFILKTNEKKNISSTLFV